MNAGPEIPEPFLPSTGFSDGLSRRPYRPPGTADALTVTGDGVVEPDEDETTELVRAGQNPVASLISLPFQTLGSAHTTGCGKTGC